MTSPQYRQVPAQVDLPALEHAVLDFWRESKVFAKSLEQSEGRPEWVFYEGPPTANGMPGAHHIEARVFKDVFPRFRTMQGYHVGRKAGWDCHGLPVELAVEKELGFNGKKDIEAYGIAEFNAKCRESVTRHTDAFSRADDPNGLLGRPGRRVPHDGPVVRRLRLVVAEGDLQQGPAGPGPPRRPVVPALRHRPLGPRAGAGLRDGRRPLGLRTLPADLRPVGRRGRPAGLDDHPVDPGLQHRGRRAPRRHLRRRDRRRGEARRRPAAPGEGTRRGLGGHRPVLHRPRDGALDVRAPLRPGRLPGPGALRRQRRVRDDRGRYGSGPPVPRLR